MKEYSARANRSKKGKDQESRDAALKKHIRVYFPSHKTVVQSRGGKDVGSPSVFSFTPTDLPHTSPLTPLFFFF